MRVQRLLRQAIKKTGAGEIENDPSPAEFTDALESANMMLNSWTAHGLITHHIVTENFPLVIGTGSYTIGTGGVFNTSRPNRIAGGYTRDSSNNDYPLTIIDRDRYNSIVNKDVQSQPCELYYYPMFPLGVIYFDYLPDQAYTLFIDSLKPLSELTLEADLNLPPEYEEAILYNLAERLCPDYNRTVPPLVAALAQSSYNVLSIQPVPVAKFEGIPGNRGGRYNINSGE